MYAVQKSDEYISVTFLSDGYSMTVLSTDPDFEEIVDLWVNKADAAAMRTALDTVAKLKAQLLANTPKAISGSIEVTRNGVTFNGTPIHGTVVDRLQEFLNKGWPTEALLAFMEKLYRNQRASAVNSLYDFLEKNKVTITPDGDFLAYKKVRGDYKDIYTGTISNAVGQKPYMNPWQVDEVRDNHCSSGLHVCSKEYLPSFGASTGNRVMVVKVNPEHVVAVPTDYNFAKMRCFQYEVIAEITDQLSIEELENMGVVKVTETKPGSYDIAPYSSAGDETTPDDEDCFDCGDSGCDYCDSQRDETDPDDDDFLGVVEYYEDHLGRRYILDDDDNRVYVTKS